MLIISLTVLPERCNNNFIKVLESLRTQPNIPEHLISVYVQMDELPKILLDYEKEHKGEVEFTLIDSKYRSYSKFYYASKKYNKECDIVTADDDLIYLPRLYINYNYYLTWTNKQSIVGACCLNVPFVDKEIIGPYKHNPNSKFLPTEYSYGVRSLSGCFMIIPKGFFEEKDFDDIDEFSQSAVGTSDEDYLWYKGIIKDKPQYSSGLYSRGFKDIYSNYFTYSYSLWNNYNRKKEQHLNQIKFLNSKISNYFNKLKK